MEVTAPLVEAMIVAFDEELCDAGTSAAQIRAAGSRLSAGIEQIGQTVFGRWAMTTAAGANISDSHQPIGISIKGVTPHG